MYNPPALSHSLQIKILSGLCSALTCYQRQRVLCTCVRWDPCAVYNLSGMITFCGKLWKETIILESSDMASHFNIYSFAWMKEIYNWKYNNKCIKIKVEMSRISVSAHIIFYVKNSHFCNSNNWYKKIGILTSKNDNLDIRNYFN